MRILKFRSVIDVALYLLRWSLIVTPIAIVIGMAVALFLSMLEAVTIFRWYHPWMVWLLPGVGLMIWWLYNVVGKNAVAGINLIIDEIHEPGGGVPARMTPLILITTILTHAVGGSAGREGTAVQMGGSMSDVYARIIKLTREDKRILLSAGVAAGFGAVFGTPVAGTIFALEVLAIGSIRYNALFPAFLAAVVAHFACLACGIHHTNYKLLLSSSVAGLKS